MSSFALSDITISARAAVSAVGSGKDAHIRAMETLTTGLRPCDFDPVNLNCFIGRVEGVEATAFPAAQAAFDNRATRLMAMALAADGFDDHIARVMSAHGPARIGLVLGTSTSGVEFLETCYRRRPADGPLEDSYSIRHHNDHHAVTAFLAEHLGLEGPAFTISTACSSSAKAMVDAAQLIQLGICDAVIAGGVDSLCMTSLYGFESLELVSRNPCRPMDAARDGLSIGEGAALMLLEKGAGGPYMSGYGESSDAINMSTPPPDGAGAVAALTSALTRANLTPADISFTKLHGTATPINDLAETAALGAVIPKETPAASLKGLIGHTLGAAGAIETVMALDAIEAGLRPGTAGLSDIDGQIDVTIQQSSQPAEMKHVLCNAFGFGGSNCALILSAR
ncbi:MAG: beta-ketoacyl-ACP synthase [Pseudomonadota bacterium]